MTSKKTARMSPEAPSPARKSLPPPTLRKPRVPTARLDRDAIQVLAEEVFELREELAKVRAELAIVRAIVNQNRSGGAPYRGVARD